MPKFVVEFYEDKKGNKPVLEFLLSLDKKMRAKLTGLIEILQEKGEFVKRTL